MDATSLDILKAIKRGALTRPLIANRTGLTITTVRREIDWLAKGGYVRLLSDGYISGLTQAGYEALTAPKEAA